MKRLLTVCVGVVKFIGEWAWLTLSFASGGPALIVVVWFLFQGRDVPRAGLWQILQVCSIIAAWAAWLQERRSRDDKKQNPRLRVATGDFRRIEGYWAIKNCKDDGTFVRPRHLPFRSLVLDIENDPVRSTTKSIATDIAPRLTFFCDVTGDRLFEFEGRWSDSVQPSQLPQDRTPTELKTTSIPIGAKRRLDVVMKYAHETVCCAINNESYGYDMAQNPAWKLGFGDFSVRVRLRGANVDQTFLLKFRNPQGDGPLEALSCEEVFA
jgi:hypothetical protein